MVNSPWMAFVDGENFSIRGQAVLENEGIKPRASATWFERDVFLWFPLHHPHEALGTASRQNWTANPPIRAHYYTAVQGDAPKLVDVRERLRVLEFQPSVFQKEKGRQSKRVDITLARDVLSHAYQENYDVALLVAGDGDYLPLVEEVQRRGRRVALGFFGEYTNADLRVQADSWYDLTDHFLACWRQQVDREQGGI